MTARLAHPRVAIDLTERHLRLLGQADAARAVRLELDWSGPVDLPLDDEVGVQAACGIMHVHGRVSGRPTPLAIDYASTAAGVLATQGILAALVAQARGADVTTVRTSVAQAALLTVCQYLAAATADEAPEQSPAGGNGPPWVSADGVRFEIETFEAERWRDFWAALGAESVAISRGWPPFQQRFGTGTCPLPSGLREVMACRYFHEIDSAARGRVSVVPVRNDPTHPLPDRPWTFLALPASSRQWDRPVSLPLEGIVVVESTRRLQGPMAGHVLRLLGADVVRIEPPGGDPLRGIPPMAGDCSARFRALNTGKRVVEIDLKSTTGRMEIRELVADADVFVHNWAPGKAEELSLDSGDLAFPGLVYAWASGWGDAHGADPPLGTDFLVQAGSGLAAALRPEGELPAPSLMTLTDVLGGLVCAEGILAALLTRAHTGRGSRVDTSLFSAAGTVPRQSAPGRSDYAACDDLRGLARDPRFAAALGYDGYTFPLAPWEFS